MTHTHNIWKRKKGMVGRRQDGECKRHKEADQRGCTHGKLKKGKISRKIEEKTERKTCVSAKSL